MWRIWYPLGYQILRVSPFLHLIFEGDRTKAPLGLRMRKDLSMYE
jgi:hypothetical protein